MALKVRAASVEWVMSKRKTGKKTRTRGRREARGKQPASDYSLPKDALQWPVVRAYVPQYEAWMATGLGTAGIIRQRPDGKWASAYFWIALNEGGIDNMFGKPATDEQENKRVLDDLGGNLPPYEEGDAELAARYVWGAYAWSMDKGYVFDGETAQYYLGLLPRLSGTRNWWLQQFVDPQTGLVPKALIEVMLANEPPEDLPHGKELVIYTEVEFALTDTEAAVQKLRREKPEFEYGGDAVGEGQAFAFTRQYPKNHWSPLSLLGGRQAIGEVRITPGRLVASAQVLSMATRLIARLRELLGDAIDPKRASWQGIHDREPFVETFV